MQERQPSDLFRPYVRPAETGPGAPPAECPPAQRPPAEWPPAQRPPAGEPPGGARHARATDGSFGQHPDVKRAVQGGAAIERAGWRVRRNWIIATVALGVLAAVVLVVIVTRHPSAGPRDQALVPPTVGDFEWSPPDAVNPVPAASTQPMPTVPEAPPVRPAPAGKAVAGAVPGRTGAVLPATGAPKPAPPKPSAAPAQNATAYTTIQAEDFDAQSGVKTEADQTDAGVHVGFISTGDWVRYDGIGFTAAPATAMLLSASDAARQNRTGQVDLRLDSRSNAPIASLTIPDNGDWFTFTTYRLAMPPTTGVHTVFLTFTSGQDEEFANIDWFTFEH